MIGKRVQFGWATLLVGGAVLLSGCEQEPQHPSTPNVEQRVDLVEMPSEKPDYKFAPGVADEQPEIAGFMRSFLETCLAGDYAGYRRLVSRRADPESRARFQKILHALTALTIEGVRPIEVPQYAGRTFVVTCKATFRPEVEAALRLGHTRRIAILVIEEDGDWRMTLAPSSLQPPREPETQPTTTEPAEPEPDYPWEQGIDS